MEQRRGFTMVELLLGLGLVSLLLMLLFVSYRMVIKGRIMAENRIMRLDSSRAMCEKFRRDVHSLWKPVTKGLEEDSPWVPVTGKAKKSVTGSDNPFKTMDDLEEWSATRVVFSRLTRAISGSQLTGEVVQAVEWNLGKDEGKLSRIASIVYRLEGKGEEEEENVPSSTVSCDVSSAQFGYYDGEKWFDKWDLKTKGRYPDKLKLTLEFEKENVINTYSITASLIAPGGGIR